MFLLFDRSQIPSRISSLCLSYAFSIFRRFEHRLYHNANLISKFTYKKLSGQYHGSGCTLSSAIAALLANNVPVEDACKKALDYTYQSLLSAKKVGKMQYHPNRTFPKQL